MNRRQLLAGLAAGALAGCLSTKDEAASTTRRSTSTATDATETPIRTTLTRTETATSPPTTDATEPTDVAETTTEERTTDGTDERETETDDPTDGAETSAESDSAPSERGWPLFAHDLGNSGFDPDGSGPKRSGEIAWRFDPGTPTMNASPVAVDGTIYTGSSGSPGNLFALDLTGSAKWEFETAGYITSAPAVVDGTVYVGGWDKQCYAVDATDGSELWRTDLGHRVGRSSPAVVNGTVYLGTIGDGPMVVNDQSDEEKFEAPALVALDAATGEERWRFDEFGDRENVETSPAVADGTVYFGADDGYHALDAETGAEEWHNSGSEGYRSSPTVVGDTIYVAGGPTLRALDAASGEAVWTAELGGYNSKSSPAVADGTVYVASSKTVACADAPEASAGGGGTATRTEDPCGGESSGFVQAVSADDGTMQWTHRTTPDTRSSPAVVDGAVYFGRGSGMEAIEAIGGSPLWTVEFGAEVYVDSSPAVADGRAYIGCSDGHLYAIGER
jgi:outer membrane protein assembly factor BamB